MIYHYRSILFKFSHLYAKNAELSIYQIKRYNQKPLVNLYLEKKPVNFLHLFSLVIMVSLN